MKLIVGLGNPGNDYKDTRHNVGFMVIDYYTENVKYKEKFNGLYYQTKISEEQVIFLKPLSYMNLSGDVVLKYVNFFKIDLNDILIIRDDLDLKLGTAKIKYDSSSGGDNGVKSIINRLNSQKFTQFKIGISNDKTKDTKDYVLGHFTTNEKEILNNLIQKYAKEVINSFILKGSEFTMSKYNGEWK